MPFCYAPWTNLDIHAHGHIGPCCKFLHKKYDTPRLNIIDSNIDEYLDSDLLKEIKQDFINNKWPAGCEACKVEESQGISSKRQMDFERWQAEYKQHDLNSNSFLTASIAFGNTCNLTCITCGPQASSKWYKEFKQIYNRDIKPNHFYKENFVKDFTDWASKLIHLDVPGGEPFLSGETQQKKLLKYFVDSGQSKYLTLHYTTNASIFPDNEWWDLWQHFQEIDMQLSVDGIEERYNYIRYPGDWNVFEKNLDLYIEAEKNIENLRLSISHTLSAFNILYLDEFFTWCDSKKLPTPWIGKVYTPEHWCPEVFPQEVKLQIADHLKTSNYEDVRTWGNFLENSPNSDFWPMFLIKYKQHDEYRNLDFEKTFTELSKLIADYN